MKKFISLCIILLAFSTVAFAQEEVEEKEIESKIETEKEEYTSINTENKSISYDTITGDFFDILPHFITSSIVVHISGIDTVLRGKLVSVYKDGIVVKNTFNQMMFVSRKSISYIEIKNAKDTDF